MLAPGLEKLDRAWGRPSVAQRLESGGRRLGHLEVEGSVDGGGQPARSEDGARVDGDLNVHDQHRRHLVTGVRVRVRARG